MRGQGGRRTVYRVNPAAADRLADLCIYVEQGKSGRKGARARPLFERVKKDAALRKFDRLLVWKVSRLGRDMREVISTVYELADAEVTVVPVKSQTGPINSTMGKLLWAIQAWFAEMENEERVDAIKAGHERALASGETNWPTEGGLRPRRGSAATRAGGHELVQDCVEAGRWGHHGPQGLPHRNGSS